MIDGKTIEQWKQEHMRTPYSELDKAILDVKEGNVKNFDTLENMMNYLEA